MIILQKAIRPLLPAIANQIHYNALFELMTIQPSDWIEQYKPLSEHISAEIAPMGSENRKLFILHGFRAAPAQTGFIVAELKRHLRRIMQLSSHKHGGIL